ncbi:MAG: aminotransferase class IV [Candidatus Aquicultorales bacterium]
MLAFLNGEFVEEDVARLTPFDRGFLLGDGLFETVRVYEGIPFALERHLDRLSEGVHLLQVMGLRPRDELAESVRELLFKNNLQEAKVRITISRGPESGRPTVFITAQPFEGYPNGLYREGMKTITARGYRCGYMRLFQVKTTSHIDSAMAALEAAQAGADEAILLNECDEVVEGSKSNVFVVSGETIRTAPTSAGALPGVTRAIIIESAGVAGIEISEEPVSLEAVSEAEEVFLTGSLMEVMPVQAIDGKVITPSVPGPMTRKIADLYRAYVRDYVSKAK